MDVLVKLARRHASARAHELARIGGWLRGPAVYGGRASRCGRSRGGCGARAAGASGAACTSAGARRGARAILRARDHPWEYGLCEEGALRVGTDELVAHERLHARHDLFAVEEVDLALCRVHVDVERGGREAQREVDEWVRALGQVRRVHLLDGLSERLRLDEALVDKQQEGEALRRVVGIGDEAGDAQPEGGVAAVELDELLGDPRAVHEPRHVCARHTLLCREVGAAVEALAARHGHARVVERVRLHDGQQLAVLLARALHRVTPRRHVVEHVLGHDQRATSTGARFGRRIHLARACGHEMTVGVARAVGARRAGRHRGDGDMCDMRD